VGVGVGGPCRAATSSTRALAFEVSYLALQQLENTLNAVKHAVAGTQAFLELAPGPGVAAFGLLSHNLLSALSYLPATVAMLYAGDPHGNFNGIGRVPRDAVSVTASPFFWQVVNASQSLALLYAQTDTACGMFDLSCALGALQPSAVTMNVTTRPWYLTVRTPIPE
jgi:hypothetical protein